MRILTLGRLLLKSKRPCPMRSLDSEYMPSVTSTMIERTGCEEGGSGRRTKCCLTALFLRDVRPNVIIGRAATKGITQPQLSKRLRLPKKWSYAKLLVWTVVLSIVLLVVYVHNVMESSSIVSSAPVLVAAGLVLIIVVAILFATWRHFILGDSPNGCTRSCVKAVAECGVRLGQTVKRRRAERCHTSSLLRRV
jgi:hypothetical protein